MCGLVTGRSELRQHIALLVASALSVGLGMSGMSVFLLGIFAGPVTAELGWSLSFFQLASPVILPAMILGGPVIGWLVDRYGTRRVAVPSLLLFGLGLASLGLVHAGWMWIASWLFIGFAGTGTSGVAWAPAIVGRFNRQRGIALAIMLSGSAVMATIGPPAARLLIDELGWRSAYLALACLPIFVAAPLVFILAKPQGKFQVKQDWGTEEVTGVTLQEAVRDGRFWLMTGAFALAMVVIGGLIANVVPILMSRDYSAAEAAGMASLLGGSLIIGRLTTGAMVDRYSPTRVAAIMLALPSLSLPLLIYADGPVAAGLAVVLIGFATGAEFDLVAYLCGRVFGRRAFGQIYAFMIIPLTITASTGGPILGWIYDRTGSFAGATWPFSALVLIGAALLLLLRLPPRETEAETAEADLVTEAG